MTKCVNCPDEALYAYVLNQEMKQHFCAVHLPSFLRAKGAPLEQVERTEEHAAVLATATAKLSGKKPRKRTKKVVTEEPQEESLMADADSVEVGDTEVSDPDGSEVTDQNDGPED
jgi:hypothetical protein